MLLYTHLGDPWCGAVYLLDTHGVNGKERCPIVSAASVSLGPNYSQEIY